MNNVINKNRIGGIKFQMFANGFCKPISMIVSYIYVPIVLNYLGDEKYGIWATILSIVSWVSFFDIGIGNGLRNKLTESLSKKDGREKKLISSAYAFLAIVITIAIVILCFIVTKLNWNKIFGVTEITESLSGIIILCICFMSFNFILSICKNVLYALQKSANVSLMELSIQIINLIGIIIATNMFESSLFIMTIIYGLSMTIVNIIASIILYAKNKTLKPSLHCIDFYVGKEITCLGLEFFIIQICALVLFSTDSIIISFLYGAANVTPYNLVNKFYQIVIGIYNALIIPIWSNVTELKTKEKYDDIKNLIKKMNIFMIPFIIGSILLTYFINPITTLWLGKSIYYSKELLAFGCLYCILTIWCNTYASISNGLQIMKPTIIIAVIEASVNIPLSLLLANDFGLKEAGVLGGTVCSMIIAAIAAPIIISLYIKNNEKND